MEMFRSLREIPAIAIWQFLWRSFQESKVAIPNSQGFSVGFLSRMASEVHKETWIGKLGIPSLDDTNPNFDNGP
jgi:hypothetical protein